MPVFILWDGSDIHIRTLKNLNKVPENLIVTQAFNFERYERTKHLFIVKRLTEKYGELAVGTWVSAQKEEADPRFLLALTLGGN